MSKEEFQYLASVTTSSDLFFMIIQRVISLFFHKEFLKRSIIYVLLKVFIRDTQSSISFLKLSICEFPLQARARVIIE
ncbi:hypothetical protein RclHR1_23640002 [Rhizophagus clarus]|uniref:Uncharacterized protein n=1 Tax=Rhizophagus clarus TaxID=94130 RepID=A0A2Z6RQM3_9GLOM|nr:hypothetical protein RclHR1_23640002 [Rhizophagus clarus]